MPLSDACPPQHVLAQHATLKGPPTKIRGEVIKGAGHLVDDRHVMAILVQPVGQFSTNPATANDNYVHDCSPCSQSEQNIPG